MPEFKCDGEERHEHYKLGDDYGYRITHVHSHSDMGAADFNRLHHHAPKEHEHFTEQELTDTVKRAKVNPVF